MDAFCVDEVACAASVCDVGGFEFAVLYEFADFLFAHTVGFCELTNGVRFFAYCSLFELLLEFVNVLFEFVESLDNVFNRVLFFTH